MKISGIQSFCDDAIKNGKIFLYSPKDISVPSFELSHEVQKNELYQQIHEKLQICLDLDEFNLKKVFGKKITIEDIEKAQEAKKNNLETSEQKLLNIWAQKIPLYLEKHPDFNYSELNKSTLMHSLSSRVLDSTNDICAMSFSAAHGVDESTYKIKKDKLAASLLILKEEVPVIYKNIDNMLSDYPDKSFIQGIQASVQKPDLAVVQQINECSPKLASKLFPEQIKTINSYNKVKLV